MVRRSDGDSVEVRKEARKAARKSLRLAKALEANVKAVRQHHATPDGRGPTFRIRQALVTFRFVALLTRTPTPRPLRSSSWGYGFFADPSPRSSSDCPRPTTPGITNPRAANSHRVQALADPASAPCLRPLASPILTLPIPVGSEPSQIRRLCHNHDPWHPQSSSCKFPLGPSPGSSGDCTMPTTHGVPNPRAVDSRWARAIPVPATAPCPQPPASPILKLQISMGSEPRQIRRLRHTRRPWRFPTS